MVILKLLNESSVVKSYHVDDLRIFHGGFFIKVTVRFINSFILFIKGYSDQTKRDYSYHWQDSKNKLIIRWDNAPHYKSIDTFPHHYHEGDEIFSTQEFH